MGSRRRSSGSLHPRRDRDGDRPPVGVVTVLYVSEFAPGRIAGQVRLWLDVLNGFPSIVVGIFVFRLVVKAAAAGGRERASSERDAGGFALSIIMLPLVSRSSMEVLALVPEPPS